MSIFTLYLGDKGSAGVDGIDGLGPADIDAEAVNNQQLAVLFNNRTSQSAFVTGGRDSSAAYTDRYGRLTWARNPTITNFIEYSTDFTQWNQAFLAWTRIGATTDPFGGSDATEINLDVDTDGGTQGVLFGSLGAGISGGDPLTVSFYIKVISGTVSALDFGITPEASALVRVTLAPTDEWKRIVYPTCATPASLFELNINPRGKAGARIAIYAAQLENGPTAYDIIPTNGSPATVTFNDYQIRESNIGSLLEGQKTNLVVDSNNLNEWAKTNCTITQYNAPDAFGHSAQNVRIVYGSLAQCSVEGDTDPLIMGNEYNVSFYAYLTAGSLQNFSVELGGGAPVVLAIPPVTGFQRFSVKATAGADDKIKFTLNSPSLTAQLVISNIQVETGDLTSYIFSCGGSAIRLADEFNFDYAYNFPAPNLPFTLSFKIFEMPNGSTKKYVFSNGLATTDEFSLYYEDEFLVMNNGGNLASVDMINYNQVGLVYDGADLKFYAERVLIDTVALSSTSTIATTCYIGYNGTDGHINAYLSNVLALNTALTHNNMLYLQGL